MRILLLGCNGQVGWELQRSLAPLGSVIPLSRQGRDGLTGDLADPEALVATVKTIAPDVIVNAAAYTAVDRAESEPERARIINAEAPAVLAREAKKSGTWLVHYSTDYIFDGSGTDPWREDDPKGPINIYGQTKLEGEEAIRQSGCHYLIFRTSWVYSAHGKNFIYTILGLASKRNSLKVINDQIGAPTGAELISDTSAHAIRSAQGDKNLCGTYNLAAAGETSWWNYSRVIIDTALQANAQLQTTDENILPVTSEEFRTEAERPKNSRLDTALIEHSFSLQLPFWEQGVIRTVKEILRCDYGVH